MLLEESGELIRMRWWPIEDGRGAIVYGTYNPMTTITCHLVWFSNQSTNDTCQELRGLQCYEASSSGNRIEMKSLMEVASRGFSDGRPGLVT